jgi:anthranilate/para-aminobenzoate synthase component II
MLPGIEGDHEVMRYHSLSLDEVAAPLEVVARTPEGVVMAIAHGSRPVLGLQFHPDSFATPTGEAMLSAFFRSVA